MAFDTAPAVDTTVSDPESLAAKLMRIRAVVEDVRNNRASDFDDDQEEDLAATGAPALSDDFGFDLDLSHDVPEPRAAEEARAAARAEPVAVAEDIIETEAAGEDTADAADATYDEVMVDEIDDGEWEEEPDLAALIAASTAPEAPAETVAEVEAMPEDASEIAVEAEAETVVEAEAPNEVSDEDLMSRISALGITAQPQAERAAAPVEAVEETAEAVSDYDDADVETEAEVEQPHPSLFQRARARVIRFAKSGDAQDDHAEVYAAKRRP